MDKQYIQKQLISLALSFFRKDFFSTFHGSLSAKTGSSRFLINKKDSVFDNLEERDFIELYFKQDYRWKMASLDADIHHNIYAHISDAKFVCFSIPPYTMAYALKHEIIEPKDYFGHKEFKSIEVFDPKKFEDWYERAQSEIMHYLITKQKDLMIIRGYGVYTYNRDLHEIVKKLAILEESCKLLLLSETTNEYHFNEERV